MGGYITGSHALCDFIRSFASGFIFTTALPPAVAAAATASIAHLKQSSSGARACRNRQVARLRARLDAEGIPHLRQPQPHHPGDDQGSGEVPDAGDILMRDWGIYVQPINYPTVPKGTERLRFTPGPLHTDEDIEYLVMALKTLWKQCAVAHAWPDRRSRSASARPATTW
jgi:5-aminolevulinate synthase